jgi:hypothetical protein
MVVRQNWNAVLRLEHKGKARVIYQDRILESAVHRAQIFGVKPLLEGAVLPVESVGKVFLMRVEVIKDDICVGGTASCENDDFSNGGKFFQEVVTMRSNSDTCLYIESSTEMIEPPSTGKSSFTV